MSEPFNYRFQRDKKRAARDQSAEEWDSVFSDENPTRVLSPQESHADDYSSGSYRSEPQDFGNDFDDRTEVLNSDDIENPSTENISATRKRRTSPPNAATWSDADRTEPLSPADYSTETASYPATEDTRVRSVAAEPAYAPARTRSAGAYEDEMPLRGISEDAAKARNSRIHFFPAFLGWLVTYSLLTFSDFFHRLINQIFGLENFSSFPQAFAQAIGLLPGSGSAPWTWFIIASILIVLSAGCGGYAAARMARFAPAKQGFGVWLWHLGMVLLATIMTFFAGSLMGTGEPQLALQTQLDGAAGQNILGILVVIGLILIGALLGSFFGPRYHRRIVRQSQQQR